MYDNNVCLNVICEARRQVHERKYFPVSPKINEHVKMPRLDALFALTMGEIFIYHSRRFVLNFSRAWKHEPRASVHLNMIKAKQCAIELIIQQKWNISAEKI